jgi:broad specificity phosphatase PhoE/thiamine kinase-like enzyme
MSQVESPNEKSGEPATPLMVVLVNVQKSFFSVKAPVSYEKSHHRENVSKSRLISPYWVGEKTTKKVLGSETGVSRPLYHFLKWVFGRRKAPQSICRLFLNTGEEVEHLLPMKDVVKYDCTEEHFFPMADSMDVDVFAKLKEHFKSWAGKHREEGRLGAGEWPKVMVLGGWTDQHVYHACYELRSLLGHSAKISTCSMLTGSPRDDYHWASLSRLQDALDIHHCRTVLDGIQWCKGTKLSLELSRRLMIVPDRNSWPIIEWNSNTPESFDYGVDNEILAMLYRGIFRINLSTLHGGHSGGLVLYVQATSHGGHKLKPTVVKIDKRELLAGEYDAFCRIEDILGNNAPSVQGFIELGSRAGVKFRCTGMSTGNNSTLFDRFREKLPVSQAIQEIFENIFDGWYASKRLESVYLHDYYTIGFESSIGRLTSALGLTAEMVMQIGSFLKCTPGEEPGRYHREDPRCYASGSLEGKTIQLSGLPPYPNIGFLMADEKYGTHNLSKMPPQNVLVTYAHGDAHLSNFIVDANQNVWVIDFALSYSNNHILRDIIRMLSSVLYVGTPINSAAQLQDMVTICSALVSMNNLCDELPEIENLSLASDVQDSNNFVHYAYNEMVRPIWQQVGNLVRDPDHIELQGSLQFLIGFYAESLRFLKYRTPTLYNKQLAYIVAGLAASAAIKIAKKNATFTIDKVEVQSPITSLFIGTLSFSILPRTSDEQKVAEYVRNMKSAGVSHLIMDFSSVKTMEDSPSAGSWMPNITSCLSSACTNQGLKLVGNVLNVFEASGEALALWVRKIVQFLSTPLSDSHLPPNVLFAVLSGSNSKSLITSLAATMISMGVKIEDIVREMVSLRGIAIKKHISVDRLVLFRTTYQHHLVQCWVSQSPPVNLGRDKFSLPNPNEYLTPRQIFQNGDSFNQTLLDKQENTSEAIVPISIATFPSETAKIPIDFEPEQEDEMMEVPDKVNFLQALALKKITISADLTLDEYLRNTKAFFDNDPMAKPIDLRNAEQSHNNRELATFVAQSLLVSEEEFAFEQVLSTLVGAKGRTGDAVSFITDTGPGRHVLAVMKIFQKVSTFENELAALSRAGKWLLDDPNKIVDVPRALSAEFILLPGGRTGGVLIMTAALGSPLDDLMLLTCRAAGGHRRALFERLIQAVNQSARAFYILHTKHLSPSPRNTIISETVDQCKDIINKVFLFLNKFDDEPRAMTKKILGSESDILKQIETLSQNAKSNTGLGCVAHGDAHCGNVFVSDPDQTITLIDLESINRSVGAKGEAIGSAAEDLANFTHKLGQGGRDWGLSDIEIGELQVSCLSAYNSSKEKKDLITSASVCPQQLITQEMFDLFFCRRQLGEIHRKLVGNQAFTDATKAIVALRTTFSRIESRNIEELEDDEEVDEVTEQQDSHTNMHKYGDNFASDNEESTSDESASEESDEDTLNIDDFIPDPRLKKAASNVQQLLHSSEEDRIKKSNARNISKWLKIYKHRSKHPRRLSNLFDNQPVFMVFGVFPHSLQSSKDDFFPTNEKLLKRLLNALFQHKSDLKGEQNPAVFLIGGRQPCSNISVARRMKRWLHDFGLSASIILEELSLSVIEQVMFAFALLQHLKRRSGAVTIVCTEKMMPLLSHIIPFVLKRRNDSRSSNYNFEYRTVVTEPVISPVLNLSEDDIVAEIKKVKKYGRSKCFPYDSNGNLLWASRAGALLKMKDCVLSDESISIDQEKDSEGRTALHITAALGHYDCAFLLLKMGAYPNLQDSHGATPLHYACASGSVEVVELLVEHGASCHTRGAASTEGKLLEIFQDSDFVLGNIAWRGNLLPYEIVRFCLDEMEYVRQADQPEWSAILFLVQPTLDAHPDVVVDKGRKKQSLILIRHGESIWNAQGPKRSKGLTDAAMSIRGFRQCAYLKNILQRSNAMQKCNVDLFVVSPLTRALQTHTEILNWYAGAGNAQKVVVSPLISERLSSTGSRGSKRSLLEKSFPFLDFGSLEESWWFHPNALARDKHESDKMVTNRIVKFLQWLSDQPERNIVVVGHGHAFRVLCRLAHQRFDQNLDLRIVGSSPTRQLNTNRLFRCNLDVVSVELYSG